MKKILLFFVNVQIAIILNLSNMCYSQDVTNLNGKWIIKGDYTFLRGKSVIKITQDIKGNIWTLSNNDYPTSILWSSMGFINMYDGKSWYNFSNANIVFNTKFNLIIPDSCGNVFFISTLDEGIIIKYDGKIFIDIRENLNLKKNEKIKLHKIDCPNTLWIGTQKGLIRYSNNIITKYFPDDDFTLTSRSRASDVCISDSSGFALLTKKTIYRYSNGSFKIIKDISDKKYYYYGIELHNDTVWTFVRKRVSNETLQMLEPIIGLEYYDKKEWKYYPYQCKSSFAEFIFGNNNILLNDFYQPRIFKNGQITDIPVPIKATGYGILPDSMGNIWLPAHYFINDRYVEKFSNEKTVITTSVSSYTSFPLEHQKGGIMYFDGKKTTLASDSIKNLNIESINCMIIDKNQNIWFGNRCECVFGQIGDSVVMPNTYILKFNGKNWTIYNDIEIKKSCGFNTIYQDNLGRIWFGSILNGIFLFENNNK